jgi:hypothetical protein
MTTLLSAAESVAKFAAWTRDNRRRMAVEHGLLGGACPNATDLTRRREFLAPSLDVLHHQKTTPPAAAPIEICSRRPQSSRQGPSDTNPISTEEGH